MLACAETSNFAEYCWAKTLCMLVLLATGDSFVQAGASNIVVNAIVVGIHDWEKTVVIGSSIGIGLRLLAQECGGDGVVEEGLIKFGDFIEDGALILICPKALRSFCHGGGIGAGAGLKLQERLVSFSGADN